MFDLGMQELILIFIVALLVFGPKRLPELSRALGKGIRELKTAMRGVKESIEEAETDISEEIKEAKNDIEESISQGIQSDVRSEEEKKERAETQTGQNISKAATEENNEKVETDKDG